MKKRNEEADLKKLAKAFFEHLIFDDGCEFGSVGLDCKRPFGDSSVEYSILVLIEDKPQGEEEGEWSPEQYDYARELYCEKLIPYLKKTCAKNFS